MTLICMKHLPFLMHRFESCDCHYVVVRIKHYERAEKTNIDLRNLVALW